jgi:hypothetical protein
MGRVPAPPAAWGRSGAGEGAGVDLVPDDHAPHLLAQAAQQLGEEARHRGLMALRNDIPNAACQTLVA